MIKIITKKTI